MPKDILYSLRCLHGRLYEWNEERKKVLDISKKILNVDKKTILFVLTPTHGNLGDHAIAIAVETLLQEININFLEITANELTLLKKHKKLGVMNGYPILVNGGGNIGTLWPSVEEVFRAIIKDNPDSKIICLPNTAYFEDSPEGRNEYEKSKQIYNGHSALQICARERITYELLKKIHKNIELIPDMVLSLNKSQISSKRSGCLLCLRTDCEKTRTAQDEQVVQRQAHQLFGNQVFRTDMVINKQVLPEYREVELEKKYDEFRSAELVITDRLHGMIFAAITGTPCIVINSKSPKVKGCYEWIQHLKYIQFAENPKEIAEIYKTMPKEENYYDNSHLQIYYDKLKGMIQNLAE